jgi:hypothetical protein
MSVSKRPRTNEKLVSIPELYEQCVMAENNLATPQDLDKFKLILAKGYFLITTFFYRLRYMRPLNIHMRISNLAGASGNRENIAASLRS